VNALRDTRQCLAQASELVAALLLRGLQQAQVLGQDPSPPLLLRNACTRA
jgi:hypothetical protein